MKTYRTLMVLLAAGVLLTGASAFAKTCCEKAFEEGKECKNKCCLAAHRNKRSCEKCNPGKEDLKIMQRKAAEKKQASR